MNTAEARRWLEYAQSDMKAAQALLQNPDHFPRQVCFLAQQVAEKSLRAVLVFQELEYPFTHDLDRLRESLPAGWRVKVEFPHLYSLSIWAVESRYPGDLPPVVEGDARQALELAGSVYKTIAEEIQKRIDAAS
jgi:HEPN domain-containing protein